MAARYRYSDEDDAFRAIEQAFRDAGRIEPQQPAEGELIECPLEKTCESFKEEECDVCTVGQVRQAQLAHDKARMGKLPSEDELAIWLCDHLSYTSRGLAQLLRERLEPQQFTDDEQCRHLCAEGELVSCPNITCQGIPANDEDCAGCDAYAYAKAQLAHDKATMAKWMKEQKP